SEGKTLSVTAITGRGMGNSDFLLPSPLRGSPHEQDAGSRIHAVQRDKTSGLMQLGGILPSRIARMLSTTMFAIRSRTSTTPLPRWGVRTTFGILSSAAATLGSC